MRLIRGVAIALMLAAPAAAQQAPAPGFSALEGIVVDSLRGGFLRGAVVSVSGMERFVVTDSLGRYRLDSIVPGTRVVELSHEMLDTLGVRVMSPQIEFALDSTVILALDVPSSATIISAKCQRPPRDGGAVFGLVLDADSELPIHGAEIILSWIELTVGPKIGVRYEPQRRTVTTDAAGRYRICGLPADFNADMIAARGSDSTSAVGVSYAGSGFALATIFLGTTDSAQRSVVPAQPGAAQPGAVAAGTVRGIVIDSAGNPISGARVGIASSPDAAVTEPDGTFTLSTRRSGTQALMVRRLGYQPEEISVNVTRRAPREVTIRLKTLVPVLEAVLVQARRDFALERVGFAARRRVGTGKYLSFEDLARRHALSIDDFLVHIPSLRRDAGFAPACITYWVDGMRWLGSPDDAMSPSEVGAIEAYSSSFVPAEFQNFDMCAVVVIWTKWKLGIR